MNRTCTFISCKKSIHGHVFVVNDRDFCGPKCQRIFDREEALLDKNNPPLWRLRRRGKN